MTTARFCLTASFALVNGLSLAPFGETAFAQGRVAPGAGRPRGPMTALGDLCIEKYNDLNGNGVVDPGEPPMAGWQFDVFVSGTAGYQSIGRWVTGSAGRFCSRVPAGSYRTMEIQQPGWVMTYPNSGYQPLENFGAVNPEQSQTIVYANHAAVVTQHPGMICVTKYRDANGNAVRDSGEPALPGWQFTISDPAHTTVAQGTTDAAGEYCKILPPGSYRVAEVAQPGWVQTSPPGGPQLIMVPTAQTIRLAFGNRPATPTRICVDKYNDLDGNGARDPGEPALPGFTFTLIASNNNGSINTTDASGSACFTVNPGSFRIVETVLPGWANTDPGPPTPEKTVSVALGNTAHLVFGNRAARSQIDLRIDTAFNVAVAPNPAGRVFLITVSRPQSAPLQAGSQLTVQGSLVQPSSVTAPVVFAPMVASAGWNCSPTS